MGMNRRKADALSRLTRAYLEGMEKVLGEGVRVVVAVDPDPADENQGVLVLHRSLEFDETLTVLASGIHTMYSLNEDLLASKVSTKH